MLPSAHRWMASSTQARYGQRLTARGPGVCSQESVCGEPGAGGREVRRETGRQTARGTAEHSCGFDPDNQSSQSSREVGLPGE